MGEIKKVGDEYYIEFYARGLKYQQKAGSDKEQAQKLLEDVEERIAHGELGTIVRDVDVDIFFKDFLEYAHKEYGARTLGRYEKLIEHFHQFLKDKFPELEKLSLVTPKVIEQYRAFLLNDEKLKDRELKPNVVNFTLLLLKDVLEHGRKVGYLNDNPMLHIRLVEDKNKRIVNVLSKDQQREILEHIDPAYLGAIKFLLYTGAQVHELLQVKLRDIDWTNMRLYIAKRTVPIDGALIDALKDKSVTEGYDVTKIRHAFGQAQKTAQMNPLPILALRHTFAKNILERNFSIVALSKILGFHDVARAMIYCPFIAREFDDPYITKAHGI